MTLSRWHEDLAAHDEAFACLQDLLDPSSFATTVVKAFREWGQGLLRLATALVRENAALERENATLRDRIAELERSAALDSTTSSKPPASDGLRKKSGTQRRTRSQRGKSGRPSGGQPGHKGTTLARTESPDHVVDHDPSACSGCGAPLSDADRHRAPVCRQVFDVPEPRPLEVTEHRAHRCLCGACATVTGAVFPDGVTAPVQYGPRITAWVSYLLYAQFVPEKRLAELMSDLFAVSISTATITAMGRRTARRFEPFLAHVADVIRTAVPVKHLDETGLRIAARTRWLHVLCTPFLTVLRIGAGRGDVEKDLEGILIHDDYAAYFTLKGVRHGACNAHHLRELQALIDIEKEDWAKSMHRLLERAHRATRFSRENGRDVPASLAPPPARISRAWAGRVPGRGVGVVGASGSCRANQTWVVTQEDLRRDPHAGDLYIFRGRRGDLVKCLWHDGVGISLYAKRLERGRQQGFGSPLDLVYRGFDLLEVAATGIGQFGAPARAVDQGGSEEFLETSDLMANGRFRQAEALGRIAISIVRGRGVKRAQRGKRWQRGLALRHCPSVRQM